MQKTGEIVGFIGPNGARKNNYNKYDNWDNRHYKWKYYNK